MIVVAAVGLILSLVAYEQRLKGWAKISRGEVIWSTLRRYPAQAGSRGLMYKSMLLDGTWSVLHHKTPQAEWHERKKWEYHRAIVQTNFLLIATLVCSVSLWLVGKVALGRLQRVHRER